MFNKTGPMGPTLGATPFQAGGFGQSAQNALGAPSPAPQNIFGTQKKAAFGNGNAGFGGIVACANNSSVSCIHVYLIVLFMNICFNRYCDCTRASYDCHDATYKHDRTAYGVCRNTLIL